MRTGSRVRRFEVAGLRVLVEPVESPLVALCLSVGAGSRFDGQNPGLAHMTEHMLFQGTERFDQFALNRRAAEVGGGHNAFTGYDTMSLNLEAFPEDVAGAVELLLDQFYHPLLDPRSFRKEQRVVLDELRRLREDPAESLSERAWREFYADPIGNPIAGNSSTVRALTTADVTRFFRRYLVNANAVLAIVGDVDVTRVRRLVSRHVDRNRVGRRARPGRVRPGRSRSFTRRSKKREQSHFHRLQAIDPRPRAFLSVEIALDLVGADPDGQLFQAVREDHGLGYEVSAEAEWGSGFAVAAVSASAGPGEARRLASVINDVLAVSLRDGFSEADIERARQKRRYDFALLSERRLDRAVAHAEAEITGFPSLEEVRRILDELSPREIQAAWSRAYKGRRLEAIRDSNR